MDDRRTRCLDDGMQGWIIELYLNNFAHDGIGFLNKILLSLIISWHSIRQNYCKIFSVFRDSFVRCARTKKLRARSNVEPAQQGPCVQVFPTAQGKVPSVIDPAPIAIFDWKIRTTIFRGGNFSVLSTSNWCCNIYSVQFWTNASLMRRARGWGRERRTVPCSASSHFCCLRGCPYHLVSSSVKLEVFTSLGVRVFCQFKLF